MLILFKPLTSVCLFILLWSSLKYTVSRKHLPGTLQKVYWNPYYVLSELHVQLKHMYFSSILSHFNLRIFKLLMSDPSFNFVKSCPIVFYNKLTSGTSNNDILAHNYLANLNFISRQENDNINKGIQNYSSLH